MQENLENNDIFDETDDFLRYILHGYILIDLIFLKIVSNGTSLQFIYISMMI